MRTPSLLFTLLLLMIPPVFSPAAPSDDTEEATPRPRKKKTSTSAEAAKASPTPKAAAADEGSSRASGTPRPKKKAATGDEDNDGPKSHQPAATPKPAKKAASDDDESDGPKSHQPTSASKSQSTTLTEGPHSGSTSGKQYEPAASIPSSDLTGFAEQPPKVRQLIEDALLLTQKNLTYKYGSDDPAAGGMDCSGTISYLLRQAGFTDVPRDASQQYVWARKHGQFFAVISKKAGGFEFADLLPGDLLFWSGTYQIDRDPPVTHSMLYLGVERHRKQQVMFGASDGRTYDGKARNGVSVFDFHMPKVDPQNTSGRQPDFLGYARIPGLREAAVGVVEKEKADEEKSDKPRVKEDEDKPARPKAGSKSRQRKSAAE